MAWLYQTVQCGHVCQPNSLFARWLCVGRIVGRKRYILISLCSKIAMCPWEYGQNGDKPKRRKSKRRHQNGDRLRGTWPKRRQRRLVKTATKDSKMLTGNSRFGQLGDTILVNWATHMWTVISSRKLPVNSSPQTTTALYLGRLLRGDKHTSKKHRNHNDLIAW